jgi:hypothetical protein
MQIARPGRSDAAAEISGFMHGINVRHDRAYSRGPDSGQPARAYFTTAILQEMPVLTEL